MLVVQDVDIFKVDDEVLIEDLLIILENEYLEELIVFIDEQEVFIIFVEGDVDGVIM